MPEANGPHRNILLDPPAPSAAPHFHSTEEVVALIARACRSVCGEVGDDAKVSATRLMFTRTILDLRAIDPKTDAVVRRLAHERLRTIANDNPAAIPLKEDANDPWHAHFLLLTSDINLLTYVARQVARRKEDFTADELMRRDITGFVRVTP